MATACGLRAFITKRACVRLTLLLVLIACGAIANVAVAWGFVAILLFKDSPTTSTPEEVIKDRYRRYLRDDSTHWDDRLFIVSERRAIGCERDYLAATQRPDPFTIEGFRSGWPLLSVHGHNWYWYQTPSGTGAETTCMGLLPEDALFPSRNPLPYAPLWPGFAINTAFYAGILWLLCAAPFAFRRRWRVKRGLCVKCAYDLRGRAPTSDVCPECGAAVGGGIDRAKVGRVG